jgi:hypothetical protein
MGSAADLFFDASNSVGQTLYRRITPTDSQFDEQQERWNRLADFLKSDLRERSGYTIRSWLQGSYKFGTQIRPMRMSEEFDIDLGIYYEWNGTPDQCRHSPKTLKSFVQESLIDFSEEHPGEIKKVGDPKKRCCRIHYKGSFHIDVPSYHLDDVRDSRSLATEFGWEDSDPKAIYLWFKTNVEESFRYKVRRIITYLKSWSSIHFENDSDRPSSILLTVLVAEAAINVGLDSLGPDDEALVTITDEILGRLKKGKEVPNPVDTRENLVRLTDPQLQTLLTSLEKLLEVGQRALTKGTALEAADVWQEAFEHFFPFPDENSAKQSHGSLPVPVYVPEIHVTAVPRNNGNIKFTGVNQIGPIPKNCRLTFRVHNSSSLPYGSVILWMVRNEGEEAESINDLGHRAGTGLTASENSAYSGRHFMDCIVKHGDRMIAMRRVPVIISKSNAPARNPARPDWVKFRKR